MGHRLILILIPLWLSSFSVLCICLGLLGGVGGVDPRHSLTSFKNLPANLFFFDDTESAIYHDSIEGIVYDDIPKGKAMMVIEHPFDNRYAFVLTDGTTHYRTEDRGKSWREFTVPAQPALVSKPLTFHSNPKNYGWIMYQGTICEGRGWGSVCHDETYYTKDAFSSDTKKLLSETSSCQFAHSSKDFKPSAPQELIYCVAFDTSSTGSTHSVSSSVLYSSTDFFETKPPKVEDLGIGTKNARGVIAFAIVSKFAVAALKDLTREGRGEMLLYVTIDGVTWARAHFPHASNAQLKENAYTLVESTTHSLGVDVVLHEKATIGTLFVSNSNGTYFVESLKDTNRNEMGFVDYERVYGVEGDISGARICGSTEECALHLHSVTAPHNFGRIFRVSWKMVRKDAYKYEFGDSGSVLVAVNDEEKTDIIRYSLDLGKTWKSYELDFQFRARALTTLPDSTSQKFVLLAQVAKTDRKKGVDRVVVIHLDFSQTRTRQCGEDDFERWFARPKVRSQWYKRRKPDSDCYVGEKYQDPIEHEENCECTDADYECDYNYVRNGDKCDADGTYLGSSGYRKIPGNTCTGGVDKAEKVNKKCSEAQPEEGNVIHQTFEFPAAIQQHAYFPDSKTILVLLKDHSIWQSSSEGPRFVAFYHHKYTSDRAYLITDTDEFYYTTDTGRTWRLSHLDGSKDCSGNGACHAEAYYSTRNGREWDLVDTYVKNCAWAKDARLNADPNEIICESYKDKTGNQRFFQSGNPLELITGRNFFAEKEKVFDQVVGFAKFSEYLVVAELNPQRHSLSLQVSLDGQRFATGQFPPSMHPETHAYTVLESSTKSLFLHMTMSEPPAPYWGSILKSNSNGTYFGVSLDYVNRNNYGFVDFEKMIGLDGIALVNVVGNPDDAAITGHKRLQSRITDNDVEASHSPQKDSLGQEYDCKTTKCALHVHGYTERSDPRATYSTPSVVGLLMAVGNVGEYLAPYTDSDTFLSRDGGHTWQEVHKDAHLWEFGDSGSILIMANDEGPTDHVMFSIDEGNSWREYKFTEDKMRVRSIVTVPSDTSRKFILFGFPARGNGDVAMHLDFSSLTLTQCKFNINDPGNDDFELWSPSEERDETCLFGRRTMYHRRVRDRNCYIGLQPKVEEKVVEVCECKPVDFEWCNDACVLVPGTTPLPNDESCKDDEDYWYERTPYRKNPISSCEDGNRIDRGPAHQCPGLRSKGTWFWMFMLLIPFGFTALVGYYYYRRSGLAKGTIRLPGDGGRTSYNSSGSRIVDNIASVPWFLVGVASVGYEWVASRVSNFRKPTRGYRNVPIDEDAQVLRFEDED
ncbi:vacuolar protein sorting/targeting protein 10 [Cyathus striatus]|nr:vacuolar protein sorting/targeting protein 10 [Cyathus striatus]